MLGGVARGGHVCERCIKIVEVESQESCWSGGRTGRGGAAESGAWSRAAA